MATAARTDSDLADTTTAPTADAHETPVLTALPAWGAHKPTEPSPMTGCE